MRGTLTLSLLLLVMSLTPARGDVGVVVTGEATMQPQLAAQIETWLRQHGQTLVSAPLPPEAINTLIDCFVIEDQSCARKVVEKRSKSQSVVFARIEVQPDKMSGERAVSLTAYWFEKGRDVVAERRLCGHCTDLTLRSTADDLMAALAAGAGQTDVGRLKLSTTPPGAKVSIDGRELGLTPLDQSLPAGDHTVKLELLGRETVTRKVTIVRTETTTLDVSLSSSGPSRAIPFAVIGGGAALLVTGIALFAIDEDVKDAGTTEPTYRDSAPIGVGFMAAGVAVGAVGGYLLWRSSKSSPKSASAPVASIGRDGGFVGWAGRF